MDYPITLSLLQYNNNDKDIIYVVNMTDEEIDGLSYNITTKEEVETTSDVKDEDTKLLYF